MAPPHTHTHGNVPGEQQKLRGWTQTHAPPPHGPPHTGRCWATPQARRSSAVSSPTSRRRRAGCAASSPSQFLVLLLLCSWPSGSLPSPPLPSPVSFNPPALSGARGPQSGPRPSRCPEQPADCLSPSPSPPPTQSCKRPSGLPVADTMRSTACWQVPPRGPWWPATTRVLSSACWGRRCGVHSAASRTS